MYGEICHRLTSLRPATVRQRYSTTTPDLPLLGRQPVCANWVRPACVSWSCRPTRPP